MLVMSQDRTKLLELSGHCVRICERQISGVTDCYDIYIDTDELSLRFARYVTKGEAESEIQRLYMVYGSDLANKTFAFMPGRVVPREEAKI